jgi:hypothetical protein
MGMKIILTVCKIIHKESSFICNLLINFNNQHEQIFSFVHSLLLIRKQLLANLQFSIAICRYLNSPLLPVFQ